MFGVELISGEPGREGLGLGEGEVVRSCGPLGAGAVVEVAGEEDVVVGFEEWRGKGFVLIAVC